MGEMIHTAEKQEQFLGLFKKFLEDKVLNDIDMIAILEILSQACERELGVAMEDWLRASLEEEC